MLYMYACTHSMHMHVNAVHLRMYTQISLEGLKCFYVWTLSIPEFLPPPPPKSRVFRVRESIPQGAQPSRC